MDEPAPDDRIGAFWEVARFRARLNTIPAYFGPTALESLPPPAWSFGETPEEADAGLAALLRDGSATSEAPMTAYESTGEPLPEAGTLGIVVDAAGRPRALVGTTQVRVVEGVVVEELTVLHRA